MIRRPPRSTLFPYTSSSDLDAQDEARRVVLAGREVHVRPEVDVREALQQAGGVTGDDLAAPAQDRKSTRLNSSHPSISYAVFCLKKKKKTKTLPQHNKHLAL